MLKATDRVLTLCVSQGQQVEQQKQQERHAEQRGEEPVGDSCSHVKQKQQQ